MAETAIEIVAEPSTTTSQRRFTVQTAKEAWPDDPNAGKNALCDKWIAQATEIEEAEIKVGTDQVYVAWAAMDKLSKDAMSAYQAAREPEGVPTGPDFASRFVRPAFEVLSNGEQFVSLASKDTGVTKDEVSQARQVLTNAASLVLGLAKTDFASILAVSREDEPEEKYWIPLLTALNDSAGVLETLCPRMTGVRNAAKTCGLARARDAAGCTVLRDRGEIKALVMWSLGGSLAIDEITVEPASLQKQVKGIGGALIEYLIREAAKANSGAGVNLTLLPIGKLAKKIYKVMGFEPTMPDNEDATWVMKKPAQQTYLKKHHEFETT